MKEARNLMISALQDGPHGTGEILGAYYRESMAVGDEIGWVEEALILLLQHHLGPGEWLGLGVIELCLGGLEQGTFFYTFNCLFWTLHE